VCYVKCYCNKNITQCSLQALKTIKKTKNKLSQLLLINKSATHAKTAVLPRYMLTVLLYWKVFGPSSPKERNESPDKHREMVYDHLNVF